MNHCIMRTRRGGLSKRWIGYSGGDKEKLPKLVGFKDQVQPDPLVDGEEGTEPLWGRAQSLLLKLKLAKVQIFYLQVQRLLRSNHPRESWLLQGSSGRWASSRQTSKSEKWEEPLTYKVYWAPEEILTKDSNDKLGKNRDKLQSEAKSLKESEDPWGGFEEEYWDVEQTVQHWLILQQD